MQKTALTITVTTLVLGIFGAFLHWLQVMNAFDAETGLMIRGAGSTTVFVIYCVLAAASICALTILWLGSYVCAPSAAEALRSAGMAPRILSWLLGAAAAAAGCVVMFSTAGSQFPMLQRLFGAACIVGGLAIPFLFGKRGGSGAGSMGRSAAAVVTLFYCFWLIVFYKFHGSDPILWHSAVETLALAASTAALYFVAAFFFDAGKGRRTLIALQLGAFLSISALFEKRGTAESVLLVVNAALMLLLEFLVIENLKEKRD